MEHTYKITEIVGSSPAGIDDAVRNGIGRGVAPTVQRISVPLCIGRAAKTLRNLDWFEVTDIRGAMGEGGEVGWYQVTMKVGFRLDDGD